MGVYWRLSISRRKQFVEQEHLQKIDTVRVKDRFVDAYLNITDAKVTDLVLQETEVVDAKYVSFEELIQLWEKGMVSPRERFKRYRDKLEEIVRRLEGGSDID